MQHSTRIWIRVVCAFVGLAGIAFAVTAMVIALPDPAAGGTCGPTKAAEAPIAALVNPGSIGAGAEPAAAPAGSTGTEAVAEEAEHEEWLAFVGECQEATDSRTLIALIVLVLALAVGLGGPPLLFKLAGGTGAAEERKDRHAHSQLAGAGVGARAATFDTTPYGAGPVHGAVAVPAAAFPGSGAYGGAPTEPYVSPGAGPGVGSGPPSGTVPSAPGETVPGAVFEPVIPSGWYPDPMAPSTGYRWWDGHDWGPAAPAPPGADTA